MNKNDLHFFLGGADLEMATIKRLLEKEGVAYSDGNLNWWDASVAAYKDEIEKVADAVMAKILSDFKGNGK